MVDFSTPSFLNEIIVVPIFFLIGMLISAVTLSFSFLPWYLNNNQFRALLRSMFFLIIGYVALRFADVTFVAHRITIDDYVVFAKASLFYLGFVIPFRMYRLKQLKTTEFLKKLAIQRQSQTREKNND